jgi:hypothetical protein
MAATYVRHNSSSIVTSPIDSVSVTLTGCASGNQLVAMCLWEHASVTVSSVAVTAVGTETFTVIGSAQRETASNVALQMAYLSNIVTAGNKTITFTASAAPTSMAIAVVEFSGGDTAGFYDTGTDAGARSAGSPATVNVVPSVSDAVIVAVAYSGDGALTVGAGYTLLTAPSVPDIFSAADGQYRVNAASGSQAVSMATSGSNWWAIKAAAFKPAGGSTTRGMPFGNRSTAFNGGRVFTGPIN